jgi:hypothetical protein
MRSAPEFSAAFAKNEYRILGGAHRLDAFYQLDGGQYAASLSSYRQAFRYNPAVVMKEWHRVVYALLALLGFTYLREIYIRLRSKLRSTK